MCGLLLRLRDLYKWEHGMPPWIEAEAPEVLGWIEERENLWEEILEDSSIERDALLPRLRLDPTGAPGCDRIAATDRMFSRVGPPPWSPTPISNICS